MKTSPLFRLSLALFLFVSPLARAQRHPAPAPLPGYWNVETNLTTHDHTIVRFYNGQDQLVYEEQLAPLCLDVAHRSRRCRRTSRQLTAALQQVLRDPASAAPHLLATQFGQDRRLQRQYAAR